MQAFSKEPQQIEKATFAAGCFWGVQDSFQDLKGVIRARSGYTGGSLKNPSYRDVCSGKTGHAEAVELDFDPQVISYEELLNFFWSIHDPTTRDRQGPDVGSQYRSAIFYHNPEQKRSAAASKARLTAELKQPVVTEIAPAGEFYQAEEYHQDYYKKQGIKPICHISNEKKKKDPL